jgi:hypothetical protein
MSRKRYLSGLRCKSPDEIPHQIWLGHPEFISHATGIDYYEHPMKASICFHGLFDVDNGGPGHLEDTPLPRPKSGATADGGERSEEGFGTVWHNQAPFTEPEQIWDFDPDPWGEDAGKAIEPDYALKNFRWCFQPETWKSRIAGEDEQWGRLEKVFPGKFTDARSFYCTSFMWGICIFGWDVFLMALGTDPDRTGKALQRISAVTEKMYQYFALCDNAEFVVAHDDLCMTSGPVISPEWYRKYIYPEYEKIFAPIKKAGKTVIFLSDGNVLPLAHDIAPMVDGFIFESSTPADFMFENFGKDKCLIGGIDARVLTFGTENEVEKHVKDVIAKGGQCPGYVIACSNTIPANVPIKNVYACFKAVEQYRFR